MKRQVVLIKSMFFFFMFAVSAFAQGQIIDVNFTKVQGTDT